MSGTRTIANDLTGGSAARKLLLFSWPIMASNLLQTIYGLVDMDLTMSSTKTMGVGFKSPEVAASMGRMTPQALSTQLVLITYMMNHMSEFDPTTPFDSFFQLQAKHNNEPVGGLETMRFQTDVLYRGYPMARQAQLLECFVDNYDFQVQMLEKVTAAFKAQDLNALKKASDEKIGNQCDNTPEEDAALVGNRNRAWAAKLPAIMRSAPTFFAVGSLHLPGNDGLLQLLRNQGYTVEGVK